MLKIRLKIYITRRNTKKNIANIIQIIFQIANLANTALLLTGYPSKKKILNY